MDEIDSAGFKHFLLSQSMFPMPSSELLTSQSRLLTTLKKNALENTEGKGENADNQHFLLFPECFLFYHRE